MANSARFRWLLLVAIIGIAPGTSVGQGQSCCVGDRGGRSEKGSSDAGASRADAGPRNQADRHDRSSRNNGERDKAERGKVALEKAATDKNASDGRAEAAKAVEDAARAGPAAADNTMALDAGKRAAKFEDEARVSRKDALEARQLGEAEVAKSLEANARLAEAWAKSERYAETMLMAREERDERSKLDARGAKAAVDNALKKAGMTAAKTLLTGSRPTPGGILIEAVKPGQLGKGSELVRPGVTRLDYERERAADKARERERDAEARARIQREMQSGFPHNRPHMPQSDWISWPPPRL